MDCSTGLYYIVGQNLRLNDYSKIKNTFIYPQYFRPYRSCYYVLNIILFIVVRIWTDQRENINIISR